MLKALKNQGIQKGCIEIIRDKYKKQETRVVTDEKGEYFNVQNEMKQEDPLSSLIIIETMKDEFRQMDWEKKGPNVNGKYLIALYSINLGSNEGLHASKWENRNFQFVVIPFKICLRYQFN